MSYTKKTSWDAKPIFDNSKYLRYLRLTKLYPLGIITKTYFISHLWKMRDVFSRRTLTSETIFDNWKSFKNDEKTFYFTLKALFVLKITKFMFWLFGHVVKRLDYKDNLHFKICDVITWLTNNCNAHIDQYTFFYKQSKI